MEQFRRMGPPSFKGESNPDMAESWISETEKIFRAIRCPEEDKVNLATVTLQDRVDVWWTSALRTIFQNRVDIAVVFRVTGSPILDPDRPVYCYNLVLIYICGIEHTCLIYVTV